ncbi:hypothetical protein V490_00828 [Pseudogymnoascus sp. VKM F-3557]|nr:hypothetical protein V490_00828 [Pseudogymnoascus sp. VKM F-3557]
MSRRAGDARTLFIGDERKELKYSERAVDYVIVNGLCPTNRESWTSGENIFWPDEWLFRPNPNARLCHVTNGISHASSWEDLITEGESLLREVDQFRPDNSNVTNVPLIFLCYGLGGIVFLKALDLSKNRQSQKTLNVQTTGVVFFGTPLAAQKQSDLKKTLQNCATVELRLSQAKWPAPNSSITQEISELLNAVKYITFKIVAAFEKSESSLGQRRQPFLSKKTVIVPEHIAKAKDAAPFKCVGYNRDHLSIAQLDRSSFGVLVQTLQTIIDNTPYTIDANIPDTGIQLSDETSGLSTQPQLYSILQPGNSIQSIPSHLSISVDQIDYTSFSNEAASLSDEVSRPRTFSEQEVSSLSLDLSNRLSLVPDRASALDHWSSTEGSNLEAKLPCHEIPFGQNPKFCGRTDTLLKIEEALLKPQLVGENKPRAFVISGTAGIGKTQTALHFAYHHKEKFPSILWASAETPNKLLQSLATYALTLGIISKPSEFAADAEKLMRWYRSTDTCWLLIFDNAIDSDLVLNYWPSACRSGSILITSQDPYFATKDVAGEGQELPQLDDKSAIALLLSSIPRPRGTKQEAQEAAEIVQRVGCLPIAIRTVIGQITEDDCLLSEYIEQWNTKDFFSESKVKHVNTVNARYNKSLKDLWADSFKSLNAKARFMMHVMSLIDTENIPEDLFRPLKDDTLAIKFPFLRDRVRCIRDLIGSSLISKNIDKDEISDRYFHLHRMTGAFAQMQMDAESQQAAFDAATLLLENKVWIGEREERSAQLKQYFEHVDALVRLVSLQSTTAPEDLHGSKLRQSATFVSLLRKMAWLCYGQRLFRPGLKLIKHVEDIYNDPFKREEVSGEQAKLDVELVWIYYYHGCFLTLTGNPKDLIESKMCFDTALKYHQACREAGFDRRHTLPKLSALKCGLGNALHGLGHQVDAEKAYLEGLEATPPGELFPLSETLLCRCLLFQGPARLQEASERLQKVIARRIEKLGANDTKSFISGGAGNNYNILGNLRIAQARDILATEDQRKRYLDDAYQLHLKALESWTTIFGGDHHETADVCHKLAWHRAEKQDYNNAILYLQRALTIYKSPVNRDYRRGEMARTNYKLSLCHEANRNYDEAREAKMRAEELRKEICKENSMEFHAATGEDSYDKLVNIWTL